MLFDRGHNLYMLISTFAIVGLLILFKVFIKQQERKDKILKFIAVVTVILHFSSLYVDYFTYGFAEVDSTMILPIYPCNIVMWLLVIVAFYKNKNSKIYKVLAESSFYIGIAGGILGIALNEAYASTPSLANWGVLKGLLSHSTMLLGCIYLLVGDYIKIRVDNVISMFFGMSLLLVDGVFMIELFKYFELDPPNTMFLLEMPFDNVPKWFNTWTIGILALVLVFVITSIYEMVSLNKEDRWYNRMIVKNEGVNEDERSILKNIFRR